MGAVRTSCRYYEHFQFLQVNTNIAAVSVHTRHKSKSNVRDLERTHNDRGERGRPDDACARARARKL